MSKGDIDEPPLLGSIIRDNRHNGFLPFCLSGVRARYARSITNLTQVRQWHHSLRNDGSRFLRKLAIILGAGLVACGGLWFASRPPHPSQEKITEMLKAQAEVEDSVKCSHDFRAGSSAYVQCMVQLDAARMQGSARAQLDTKGAKVTSTVAGVGAAMVMLFVFVTMMLIFCGFWALGTRIGLDEMRR